MAHTDTKSFIIPMIIISVIVILIDLYSYKGLRLIVNHYTSLKVSHIFTYFYWFVTSLFFIILFYILYLFKTNNQPSYASLFLIASIFMAIYLPKLIFISFHLVEDIIFYITKLVLPSFSRFYYLSNTAIIISAIISSLLFYGILWGKFDFTVRNEKLYFNNLPKEFDGFRILMFSDMHIGSFENNPEKISEISKLINAQKADIVCFAGDMVNNISSEVNNFIPYFKEIQAPFGKFSIIGNHDYGDYYKWNSDSEKTVNFNNLILKETEMGFRVLLNEAVFITKDNAHIALVGVENWGKPPFPKHGDLKKALVGTDSIPFKILLSHDPSHWDAEVNKLTNISLTLSGHTHGMQFGIRNGLFKWSPGSLKYKKWGGLYSDNEQYLYVSTGLGFIGYAGRVGIPPEIIVFELHSK